MPKPANCGAGNLISMPGCCVPEARCINPQFARFTDVMHTVPVGTHRFFRNCRLPQACQMCLNGRTDRIHSVQGLFITSVCSCLVCSSGCVGAIQANIFPIFIHRYMWIKCNPGCKRCHQLTQTHIKHTTRTCALTSQGFQHLQHDTILNKLCMPMVPKKTSEL